MPDVLLALALRTLRALADGPAAFVAQVEREGAFDGAAYASLLFDHRVLPFVEGASRAAEVRTRLPAALVASVEAGAPARARRAAAVLAQTLEVQDVLDRAGIPCLHLKGVTLATRFLGDARRRHQHDVDVLVRPRDRDGALAALESAGYVREPGPISRGVVRWGLARGATQAKEVVDVHWNLRRRARRRVTEDFLWADTAVVSVGGRALRTLGDDALLTFLLLSVCGDLGRGACQLRHLLDIFYVVRGLAPTLDAEAFVARRAAQRLRAPCVEMLAVAFLLLPPPAEASAFADAVRRRSRSVHVRDRADALALLSRPRGSAPNEVWFRRAYPYDRWGAFARAVSVDLPHTLSRLRPGRRLDVAVRTAPGLASS